MDAVVAPTIALRRNVLSAAVEQLLSYVAEPAGRSWIGLMPAAGHPVIVALALADPALSIEIADSTSTPDVARFRRRCVACALPVRCRCGARVLIRLP